MASPGISPDKYPRAAASAPRYLVLFQERSDRNASVMSKILRVGEAPERGSVRSTVLFNAPSGSDKRVRIFQNVAVAATDLTPAQKEELERSNEVRAIVENAVRRIPPLVTVEMQEELAAMSGLATTVESSVSPAEAFLNGMQSAIDAIRPYVSGTSDVISGMLPAIQSVAAPRFAWPLAAIGIRPGYSLTGKGVTVAVLDTGVNRQHPDFGGRFAAAGNTQSFVPGESVDDFHGHGTHCAGVIGAAANAAGGVRYSVAPEVELLAGKVLANDGSGFDDWIIEGMEWAADQGARVISMSLGSVRQSGAAAAVAYETIASTLLDDGILVVAAAGNESNRDAGFIAPVGNPAACASIMAVAAMDRQRQVADFSCGTTDNIGEVDITGPGVAIYSAWKGMGRRYAALSGTSMATPHIAGVGALILEQDPELSGVDLWKSLLAGARDLGSKNDFGAGLVQAP